jgi:hypothetical protein
MTGRKTEREYIPALSIIMSRSTQFKSLLVNPAVLTQADTLTNSDLGRTFFLNAAGGFAITLPKPTPGASFKFFVKTAPTGAYTIVSTSSANIVKGQIYTTDVNSVTDPDFETTGGDTITFVANTAVLGDSVDLISDGVDWYVNGFCSVYNAITITTAS